ncbi:MAG: cadherin-like beta sandwich domain-containing protein, partial [Bacilli bacterium]|nr:cadherin-like beta sandwich domain-containing protein [Bacilli bacterium]
MMTNFKKYFHFFFLFLVLLLGFQTSVLAGSASLSLNGNNSVYIGNNVEVTVALNNINATDGIMGFQANLEYDASALEFVSASNLAPFSISYSDSVKTLAGLSFNPSTNIKGASANLVKLVFKTKKEGSTTIRIKNVEVTEGNNAIASTGGTSKTINITPPPSSNANLSSLSVSNGSISFNKDTINYSIKVASNVTSVSVSATAEDGGAKVSGTGNKNLNYGNNAIKVVVTAPSGNTKTYTININREDIRSSNNNLSNLTIEGTSLSPGFNTNTTSYEASVPFSIENLKINAPCQDSKSKVSISGQNGLIAEETREVIIKVTAENGDVKTYKVNVTRGKDPNKPLSNNNNLSSLTTNIGILSPAFSQDVTSYSIVVPYEITQIELNATVEDTKYGTLKKEGPENLEIGNNKYTFSVTAEDLSVKEYVVVVNRASNNIASETTALKNVEIGNGKLSEEFQKDKFVYWYKKGKEDFQIKGIAEDENNKVSYYEIDGVIIIIVEDGAGNSSAYTFIPETPKNYLLPIIGTSIAVGGIITSACLG